MALTSLLKYWREDRYSKYFCLLVLLTLVGVILHPQLSPHYSACVFVIEIFFCTLILGLFVKLALVGNTRVARFYKENKFYCSLILTTILTITFFSVHYLGEPDIHRATKVWEVAAYLVTTIYNFWFWHYTPNGQVILDEIEDRSLENHHKTRRAILWTFIGLMLITLLHTAIIVTAGFVSEESWKRYAPLSVLATLLLIGGVYVLFVRLGILVVTNVKTRKYRRDFLIGLRYIDVPTLIIFSILFLYAVYVTLFDSFFHHIEPMEIFFSGAIAFELLLSSIVWANTKTV